MDEDKWRNEYVALDAPPTVQKTARPSEALPSRKRIPWKWLFSTILVFFVLISGLIGLRQALTHRSNQTSNSQQSKIQDVDLGSLTNAAAPLAVSKTDKVVINGQLETNQGLVLAPTSAPSNPKTGQVYLDSKTGELKYFNGTDFVVLATTSQLPQGKVLTTNDVLNLISASQTANGSGAGLTLPQDLSTTASPQFAGLTLTTHLSLNGTLLAGPSGGTGNFTLPNNNGLSGQCLATDGTGILSFISCTVAGGIPFIQGGNAFGAAGTLGTTDANNLNIITNSVTRLSISSSGDATFSGNINVQNANFTQSGSGSFATGTGAVTLNGNTSIANGKTLTVPTLGGTDTAAYLCQNSSNQLAPCSTTIVGAAFTQGGNAFGAAGTFGLSDANDLNIITNNATRLTIKSGGNVGINNTTALNRLSVNTPFTNDANAVTLISTGAGTNKGLVVQGWPSQTSNLLEIQNGNAIPLFSVGANGDVTTVSSDNSSSAFQVQTSTNTTVFGVDAQNKRVGVNIASPNYPLDVVGNVHIDVSSALIIGGNTVCTATGCGAQPGNPNYIQNGFTIQSNANLAIQSVARTAIGAQIRGNVNQTLSTDADLLQAQYADGTPVFTVGATGRTLVQTKTDSTTAFQIQNGAGNSNLFIADTLNGEVGVGIAPSYKLDVNGNLNIGGAFALKIGGTTICDSSGCGVGNTGQFIKNTTTLQTNANIAIQTGDTTQKTELIKGLTGQTSSLFEIQDENSNAMFTVSPTGTLTLQNKTDSTGAFIVKDTPAEGDNIFVVDTTNKRVGVNEFPSLFPLDVNGDLNLDNSGAYRINGQVICSLSGCSASSGSGNYIQNNAQVLQTSANFYIQSASPSYVGGRILAAAGQTADLFQVQNSSGTQSMFSVGNTGAATFQNTNNSTTALVVKNASATPIFTIDTLNTTVSATNANGVAFTGTTGNSNAYGVLGTNSGGVGGGVQGNGGGGYGVFGTSLQNVSGFFQTSNTAGTNSTATLAARQNTSQTANLLELQDASGNPASSFSSGGNQLTLGRIAASGTVSQGKLLFSDGTTDNFGVTLQATTLTANRTLTIPNETGTICTTAAAGACSVAGSGYVQLAPSSVQADATANNSIFINKTNGTGNILDLQKGGADKLVVTNGGYLGVNTATPNTLGNGGAAAQLGVVVDANTTVGAVIRAAASQSANLLELQNSSGTPVALFGSAGDLRTSAQTTNSFGSTSGTNNTSLTVNTGASNFVGLLVKGAASQSADLIDIQDSSGNINANFNTVGSQLTLGRIAGSGTVTQGKLILSDGTTDNLGGALQVTTLTASRTYTLPDETGTICTTAAAGACSVAGSGYVQLAPTSVQADATNNNSIFINKTSGTGNILDLQKGGVDQVTVDNSGNLKVIGQVGVGSIIASTKLSVVTSAGNPIGLSIKANASQGSNNLIQIQDSNGNVNATLDGTGSQLTLGRIASSGTVVQGKLIVSDGTTDNFGLTLQATTLTNNRTLTLPDESGTVCTSTGTSCSAGGSGFVQLGPTSAQTDATTNSSININKTGASGNLVTLAKGGVTAFSISNSGAVLSENTANSTAAFQIQNATGATILNADTTNMRVSVGNIGTATGQLYVAGSIPSAATGSVGTLTSPQQITVRGRYAYVTNTGGTNSLQVFDVSNPTSPTALGSVGTGSSPRQVVVNGLYAYVVNGTANTLQIINISNPNSPTIVSTTNTGTFPVSVAVQGRYAYVTNATSSTLQIFDVSNPANVPAAVGSINTGTAPRFVVVQGQYAYVVTATSNRLEVYDISNPTAPTSVGTVSTGASSAPFFLAVQGRYAYVTNTGTANFGIYDVSNPASPALVGSLVSTGTTPDVIAVQGRYAYVTNQNSSNLQIFDVSNPASVSSLGTITTGVTPIGLAVQGRYAYVTSTTTSNLLQIFDIGGSYVQQLEAGGLEVDGSANFDSNVGINGGLSIQGGLSIARGFESNSNSTVNGTFNINATNANALTIQNATGSQILNVDTTNSVIKLDSNNTGELQAWSTTSALGATTYGGAPITNGSYIYVLGGSSGGSTSNNVSYVPINANGTLGTWITNSGANGLTDSTTTTQYAENYFGSAVYNNYLYAVGGFNSSGTASQTVLYGKINTDGSINSWTASDNKIVTGVGAAGVMAYNGFLIVAGGSTASAAGNPGTPTAANGQTLIQYARLNPDGNIGSFSTLTNPLPAARTGGQVVINNGIMYFIGGRDTSGTASQTIYRSTLTINYSTGTITNSAWTTQSIMSTARAYFGAARMNGYIYLAGGENATPGTGINTVEYCAIASDGSISTCTTETNNLSSAATGYGRLVEANGYLYAIGGAGLSSVQYASGPRIQIGGSLDLVGLAGGSDTNSSSGGTLTAGNTTIVGTFSVSGGANFLQNVAINNDLFVGGYGVFRNSVNSTTSFEIQNASAQTVVQLDTINSQFIPGSALQATTVTSNANVTTFSGHTSDFNWFPSDIGKDGFPVFAEEDQNAGVNTIYVVKCRSYDCSSFVGPTSIASSSSQSGNSLTIKVQSNGNPVVMWHDTANDTENFIVCGNDSCTSGNSAKLTEAAYVGGSPQSGSNSGVDLENLSTGGMVFLYNDGSTHLNVNPVNYTGCITNICISNGGVQLAASSINTTPKAVMGYCSESDRLASRNPNTCLNIATIANANRDVVISICNSTCTSLSTSATLPDNANHGYTMTTSGGSSPNKMSVALQNNGNPIIARYVQTGSVGQPCNSGNNPCLEVIACLNMNCQTSGSSVEGRDYIEGIVDTVINSTGGTGIIIDTNDGLPVVFYRKGNNLVSVHCGTLTCASSTGLNTTTTWNNTGGFPTSQGSGSSSAFLGNDGLPFVVTQDASTNPNTFQLVHCVDKGCTQSSAFTATGGVKLGSVSDAFQSLYVNTINDGSTSGFQLTAGGVVVANSLRSDGSGNVSISSTSSTAFKVFNNVTANTVLSIDSSYNGTSGNNSVNVGTSTSVSGYGFNSAVASLFRNSTNSTAAFNIQDASGVALFSTDTTDGYVTVGNGNAPTLNSLTAGANTGGALSGAAGTTYYYKVTAVTPGGETLASNELNFNGASFTAVSAPGSALTAAASASAGNVSCNNTAGQGCRYEVTFVTANGETTVGPISTSLLNVTSKQINLSSIPLGGSGVVGRRIYRSVNNGAFTLLNSGGCSLAADNTSTTCTDNLAAPSGSPPGANTATTNLNNLSIAFSSVTGATSYKIYRGTASGAENVYQTTASSPFTDTGAAGTSSSVPATSGNRSVGINIATPTANLDVRGTSLFRTLSDSASAFQFQNAGGTTLLGIDTASSNFNFAPGSVGAVTVTSDLTSGNRSTQALVVTQANNASNHNSSNLVKFENLDTDSGQSGGDVLQVTNACSASCGSGINVKVTSGSAYTVDTTSTGVTGFNANPITSGTAFTASGVNTGTGLNVGNLTSGKAIDAGIAGGATTASILNVTSSNANITGNYTGSLLNIAPTRTLTGASVSDSGHFLNLTRSNTVNSGGNTLTVSGALAVLQSNCTQSAGTCTDSGDILDLTQSYASASGAVLNISSAGTGNLIKVTDSTSTPADVFTIADGGAATHKSQTNSTTAFQIQNASSTPLFIADTTNTLIKTETLQAITAGGFTSTLTPYYTDSNTNTGIKTAIALDSSNLAGILYKTNTQVKFLKCNAAIPQDTTHACNGSTASSNNATVIATSASVTLADAIDNNGNPRVAYVISNASTGINFIACKNPTCSQVYATQVLGNIANGDNKSLVIAIASDNTPRVAWIDNSNGGNVWFMKCTSIDCSTHDAATQVTAGINVQYLAMTLDTRVKGVNGASSNGDGLARLAFRDTTNNRLTFIQCTDAGGDCTSTNSNNVVTTNSPGQYLSMVLGYDGFGRIAELENTTHLLKYIVCSNAACSATSSSNTVATGTVSLQYQGISVGVGPNKIPQISFSDINANSYNFALCANQSCSSLSGGVQAIETLAANLSAGMSVTGTDNSTQIVYGTTQNSSSTTRFVNTNTKTDSFTGSAVGTSGTYYAQAFIKGINSERFTLQPSIDSTTAFQVRNSLGSSLLTVDTSNGLVGVGPGAPSAQLTVTMAQPSDATTDGTNANNVLTVVGAKGGNTTGTTGQIAGSGSNISLQAGSGGDAPSGSTNGNGGNLTLSAGGAGTGAGTAGSAGTVLVKNLGDSTAAFQIQNAAGSTTTFDVDTTNGRVGIGTTTPGNLLSIGALTTARSGQVAVSTGGTTNNGIIIQDVASQSAGNLLAAQDSSGTVLASIDYLGNLTAKAATFSGNLTINGHVLSGNTSGSTTVAAGNIATCIDGTHGTVSISGNDTAGTITITTDASGPCGGGGTLATITFANNYGSAPRVILSPSDATGKGATLQYYNGAVAVGSFTIDTNTAPAINTTYKYNYFVIQ